MPGPTLDLAAFDLGRKATVSSDPPSGPEKLPEVRALFPACVDAFRRALTLVTGKLGLPIGIVSYIQGQQYELFQMCLEEDATVPVQEGETLLLPCTFCNEVVRQRRMVSFGRASGSEWGNHPAYGELRFEAYIGAPLCFNGRPVGTLCFASPDPRLIPFTAWELDLVRSLARWLGLELEAADHAVGGPLREEIAALEQAQRSRAAAAASSADDPEAQQLLDRQLAERFRLLQQATGDSVYDWDLTTDLTWRDRNFAHLYEVEDAKAGADGIAGETETWLQALHPDDREHMLLSMQEALSSDCDTWTAEYRLRRRQGDYAYVHDRALIVRDEHGKARRLVGTILDNSERVENERELRAREQRFSLLADGTNDGFWDWDLQHDHVYYSPTFTTMLGYNEEDLGEGPEDWFRLIASADLGSLQLDLDAHLSGKTPQLRNEHRLQHRDGTYRWYLCRGTAVRDASGKPTRVLGSLTDITDRKEIEEALQRAAQQDSLTGMPNRRRFQERLDEALEQAHNDASYRFAVLFLDFDRFKVINDSMGHDIGDRLLIQIAERLQHHLRKRDLAARLGGDEFVVLLDDVDDSELASTVERLQHALREAYKVGELEVALTVSIGVVTSDQGYYRPQDVLRDADTAMYRAKAAGRARHAVFDHQMHEEAVLRLDLEKDLRGAVDRQELFLVYQPIISLQVAGPIGFEALLRWRHPERGTVVPDRFIPIAEETGLINPVGHWVLGEACRQLQDWQQRFNGQAPLSINVNVSRRQLAHPDFIGQVRDVLQESRLPADSLKLEITETVVVDDRLDMIPVLRKLKELGVRLSMDDFGTGLSSLSSLHRFPIDELKIDRAFIRNLNERVEYQAIIRAVVTLAHSLKIQVVAEGIEEAMQLTQIHAMGCDLSQGFYFARPMPANEAEDFLESPNRIIRPGDLLFRR